MADTFSKVLHKSKRSDEIRVIIDRYIEKPIKNQIRQNHKPGMTVRHKISDDTNTGVTMKKLLSNIRTKHDLTIPEQTFIKILRRFRQKVSI